VSLRVEVRDIDDSDLESVEALHRSTGQDFALPDLSSPLVIVKKAILDEAGKVIGFGCIKIMGEAVMSLSPDLSPIECMRAMEALQPPILTDAYNQGLDEVEARIHSETEQPFLKRLKQLGWARDRSALNPWSRKTKL
jgi:hypothetical protein